MSEYISLSEAFKLLGLNRSILNSSVRDLLDFPKTVTKKKWNHNPTYDKDEILAWYKSKGVKQKIKEIQEIQTERRIEARTSYKEMNNSTLDNKQCHLFLRGMFDPLEKWLEHETKKYYALQNCPKTIRVHLIQDC